MQKKLRVEGCGRCILPLQMARDVSCGAHCTRESLLSPNKYRQPPSTESVSKILQGRDKVIEEKLGR